jgi:pimeloyl-ACP methyl ester carboxylesterase
MRHRVPRVAGVLLFLSLLQACAPYRKVQGPILQVNDEQTCGTPARHLIVLLPGLRDLPADFVDEGFVQAVRERQLDADITLLDAHVGYYNERQIVSRLQSEVIAPARAKGYESIWLVGISLGGLGSLLYTWAHPQDITGVYAMAPYLGDKAMVKEVIDGGLAQWRPGVPDRLGSEAWQLAQAYLNSAPGLPQGFIGYGESDRFAGANAVFATALPPGHRYVAAGGHDWGAWKSLWAQFLDSGLLGRTQRTHRACAEALAS